MLSTESGTIFFKLDNEIISPPFVNNLFDKGGDHFEL